MAEAARHFVDIDELGRRRARLPFTDGMRNEVIVHRCGRSGFEFAIRQAAGRLVAIGTDDGACAEDLETAMGERTAAICCFYNATRLRSQVPSTRARGHSSAGP